MDTRSIKFKLTVFNFLEFFVFGAWLLSFAKYMFSTLHFTGSQIGSVFLTLGLASLIMPGVMGVIADKWLSPNKLFALSHLIGAVFLVLLAREHTYNGVFWMTLLYLMFYMPTIALDNTISYCILTKNGLDVVKTFPPIRVWGTIGFIFATWITDLMGWGTVATQFYFAAAVSVVLALYTFMLPDCPPDRSSEKTLVQALGLDALALLVDWKMFLFFFFSMLLGAALQITNMWGEAYLHEFGKIQEYADSVIVKYNGVVMSLSQISETVFILTIPFFLKRFGIKVVMLMSMLAWFLRFGLFAVGSPVGWGAVAIILSMIVYGMAFDFFNISGSLFVEKEVDPKIRASAQGLFMIVTNGFGAMMGAKLSGLVVDMYRHNDMVDWPKVWGIFALYALIIAILFAILFRYKHKPDEDFVVQH